MSRVVVKDPDLGDLVPFYFERSSRTKADMYGKLEGYRCSPSGSGNNKSKNGIYYRDINDLADHLLANPSWGARFAMPDGSASLRYNNIYVDGRAL